MHLDQALALEMSEQPCDRFRDAPMISPISLWVKVSVARR